MKAIKLKCDCSYSIAGRVLDGIAADLANIGDGEISATAEVGVDIYEVKMVNHKTFVEVEIKLIKTFDDIYNSVCGSD